MPRNNTLSHGGPTIDANDGRVGHRRRWSTVFLIGVAIGLFSTMASAAVLTVGDHGTYSDIQAAVNAALGAGSSEIRVERGTYVENINIGSSFVSDQLEITGGWDAAFTTRSTDASLTVIDGGTLGNRVVGIWVGGGTVLVDGFTLTNGFGGLQVEPSGNSWVTISNNRIIGNTLSSSGLPGAGVKFSKTTGDARFSLIDNLISGNTVENTGGTRASGGGVWIQAEGGAAFHVTGNRIIDNTCIAPADTVFGCGVVLTVDSGEGSVFSDNVVKGNRTVTAPGTEVLGAGGYISLGIDRSGELAMRRNLWIDNRDLGTQEGYHVRVSVWSDHYLEFSDSVIAGGPMTGLGLWTYDASIAHLTNLTVFDHADTGVWVRVSGSLASFYNTIVYDSPTLTDMSGTIATGGNLLGVDPLFVSPSTWDCHLRAGSPALDAGDNSPPGGLGSMDADGNPRVLNSTVDIGAYEGVANIFEDGFESGLTTAWSMVEP